MYGADAAGCTRGMMRPDVEMSNVRLTNVPREEESDGTHMSRLRNQQVFFASSTSFIHSLFISRLLTAFAPSRFSLFRRLNTRTARDV